MLGKAISCEQKTEADNDMSRIEERLCGCGVVRPLKIKADVVETLRVEIDQLDASIIEEAGRECWRETDCRRMSRP